MWRLTKRKRYAECRLWTHPLKAEIRVEAAGEFVRSQAGADVLALIEIAEIWKAQFHEKGWRA